MELRRLLVSLLVSSYRDSFSPPPPPPTAAAAFSCCLLRFSATLWRSLPPFSRWCGGGGVRGG